MELKSLKEAYPQLKDYRDEEILEAFRQKYLPEYSFEEVAEAMNAYRPPTVTEYARGLGSGFVEGLNSVLKATSVLARATGVDEEQALDTLIDKTQEKAHEVSALSPLVKPGGVYEGLRSFGQSLALRVPGAMAGAVVGGGIPGAVAGAISSGGAIAGLAEYHDFLKAAEEFAEQNGLDKERFMEACKHPAIISAIAESGFEYASDIVGAKIFKLFGEPVLPSVRDGLKKLLAEHAKRLLAASAAEISSEMGTAGVQIAQYRKAGLTNEGISAAVAGSIIPSAITSVGMGTTASVLSQIRAERAYKRLDKETADIIRKIKDILPPEPGAQPVRPETPAEPQVQPEAVPPQPVEPVVQPEAVVPPAEPAPETTPAEIPIPPTAPQEIETAPQEIETAPTLPPEETVPTAAAETQPITEPAVPEEIEQPPPVREEVAPQPTKPTREETLSKLLLGKQTLAFTPDNRAVPLTYGVTDVDNLVTSHTPEGVPNPNFDQRAQPRNRTSVASRAQHNSIAQNLNPLLVTASAKVSDGAPIVGIEDLNVESGNARSNAIKLAYEQFPEKAQAYKDYLVEHAAEFGLDPDKIRAIERPILVRVREPDAAMSRQEFVDIANARDVLAMSPVELARLDASKITVDDMAVFAPAEDGALITTSNMEFIRRFLSKIPHTEASQYYSERGEYTKQLADRIQNAVFAKAYYSDPSLLTLKAEDPDPEMKNVLVGLNAAAPKVSKANAGAETRPDTNVSRIITDAVRIYRQAKSAGQSVREFSQQLGLFGDLDPAALALADLMYENRRSGKRIGAILNDIADAAIKEQDERAKALLERKDRTGADIVLDIAQTYSKAEREQPALIEVPQETPRAEQPVPEKPAPETKTLDQLTPEDINTLVQAFDEHTIENAPKELLDQIADEINKLFAEDFAMEGIETIRQHLRKETALHKAPVTVSGIRTVASVLLRQFREAKSVTFEGLRVDSVHDLAEIAQILRNPKCEIFRIFYVDAQNRIVGHEAVTSRLPFTTKVWKHGPFIRGAYKAQKRMQKRGAVGYYVLHNHPTLCTYPSERDIDLTKELQRIVPGFLGHIIIDHATYSVINQDGEVESYLWEGRLGQQDPLIKAGVWHPVLMRKLTPDNPQALAAEIAEVGRALESPDKVISFYVGPEGGIRAVQEVPYKFARDHGNFAKYSRYVARNTGASTLVLYASENVANAINAVDMVKSGIAFDVITDTRNFSEFRSVKDFVAAYKTAFIGKPAREIKAVVAESGLDPAIMQKVRTLLDKAWEEHLRKGLTATDFARYCAEKLSAKGKPYFIAYLQEKLGGAHGYAERPGEIEQAPAKPVGGEVPPGERERPAVPEQPPAAGPFLAAGPEAGQPGAAERPGAIPEVPQQPEEGTGPAGGIPGRGTMEPVTEVPGTEGERGEGGVRAGTAVPTELPVEPVRELAASIEEETVAQPELEEETTEEIQEAIAEDYKPSISAEGAKRHPTKLIESAALATVSLPKNVTYTPKINRSLLESGTLSLEQYEAVVYAGQKHSEKLPNGETAGFYIGDGTGAGKTRSIAAIILDNWNQGRKRAVWVTVNQRLYDSVVEEFKAIGFAEGDVFRLSEYGGKPNIDRATGICFATYHDLIQEATKGGRTKLSKLFAWLGGDAFDGVIALDEAHRMANAIETETRAASKTGTAMIGLVTKMPNAKVVYASATGGVEPEHIAYMTRLGLWGEGTNFSSAADLVRKLKSAGVAGMELVTRDLKARGCYIGRDLSYEGVEYERIIHHLTEDQKAQYNQGVRAWVRLRNAVDDAIRYTQAKESAAKWPSFYFGMQRFFSHLMVSYQLETVLPDALRAEADGMSPVFQLVNTEGNRLSRLLNERSIDDIDLSPIEILIDFLKNKFPVQQWGNVYDHDSKSYKWKPMFDEDGNPVLNPNAVALRDTLIREFSSLKFPDNPLDAIISAFGKDRIAEVTGRTKRIVTNPDGTRSLESRSMQDSVREAEEFRQGKRTALVYSEAGGISASYHADKTFKNQRRRKHYVIQAGWSAMKAMQGFGRTHRSNQTSAPIFALAATDLPSHQRFISTIARRLDQMGAMTRGQREAARQGLLGAHDNLESRQAQAALDEFLEKIYKETITLPSGKTIGYSWITDTLRLKPEDDSNTMTKFLNRLMMVPVQEQVEVFEAYSQVLDEVIRRDAAAGRIDVGLQVLRGKRITVAHEETIDVDPATDQETKYIVFQVTDEAKNLPFEEAQHKYAQTGFVLNKKSGKIYAVSQLMVDRKHPAGRYRLASPDRKFVYKGNEELRNRDRWMYLDPEQAREAWTRAFLALPKEVTKQVHAITGPLLRVWDRLPEKGIVYRVQDSKTKKRYLAKVIPKDELADVLRNFAIRAPEIKESEDTIIKKVLDENAIVVLQNGWELSLDPTNDRLLLVRADFDADLSRLNEFGFNERSGRSEARLYFHNRERAAEAIRTVFHRISRPSDIRSEEEHVLYRRSLGELAQQAFERDPSANSIGPTKPTVSRTKIINDLRNRFDVPIGIGKFKKKKATGVYYPRAKMIRLKNARDVSTACHEVGHHIQGLLGVHAVPQEVKALAPRGKGDATKEGFAEFVSLWVTDPQRAENACPNFYKDFEDLLQTHQEVAEILYTARANWALHQATPAIQKAYAHIVHGPEGVNIPNPNDFIKNWIESCYPIRRFTEEAERILGGKLSPEVKPYLLARVLPGFARKAEQYLLWGTFQYDESAEYGVRFTGKSLRQILRPVYEKGELPELSAFLVARRILTKPELSQKYEEIGELDVWKEVYNSLKDKHAAVSDELDKYSDELLKYLVATGRLSTQQYEQIKEKNPFYVPMYRVINEDIAKVKGVGTKKLEQLYNPVKRMKGATRDVYDPVESLIYNTYVIINVAERQRINKALVELSKRPGMGKLIWRRAVPVKPVQMTVEEAVRELSKILGIPEIDLITSLGITQTDAEKLLTTFRPNIAKGPNDIILFEDGKPVLYEVPQWLAETLSAADSSLVYKFPQILQLGAQILRVGATSYNPEFAIRNPVTDQFTAFLFSKNMYIPGFHALKGIAHILKADKIWQLYNASGAAYADFVSMDRRYIHSKALPRLFHDILRGQDLAAHPLKAFFHTVSNPLETLQKLAALTEEATRVADFELSLKRYARERAKRGWTWFDVVAQSGLDARNVTQDFNRMGLKARAVNSIVAFFGASIGGNVRFFEGLTSREEANFFGMKMEQRYKVMLTGLCAYTLPSLLLYFAQRDDKYYEQIPAWRRVLCFNIILHNDDGTLKMIVSLPRKFIPGILFGALPEVFLNYIYTHDRREFYRCAKVMLDQFAPPIIPNFAVAPMEWLANKKFFFNRKIVPQGLEKLPAYMQAGPYTSRAVELLCKLIAKLPGVEEGVSPAKVDEAIRTTFGGLGSHSLAAMDTILNLLGLTEGMEPPKPTLSDMPLIRAFVQRMPTGSMKDLQAFWEKLERAEKDWEGRKQAKGIRGLGLAIPKGTELSLLQNHAEAIRWLNRLGLLVRDSKKLSGEEKRRILDLIAWTVVDVARHGMGLEPRFSRQIKKLRPGQEIEIPREATEEDLETLPSAEEESVPFFLQ